jgi:hypothetical protein
MKRLREEGRMPIAPESNELFIDIDTKDAYNEFRILLDILQREWDWGQDPIIRDTPSFSGHPHRHVVIRLPFKLTP